MLCCHLLVRQILADADVDPLVCISAPYSSRRGHFGAECSKVDRLAQR
jgi:hypothetical protein